MFTVTEAMVVSIPILPTGMYEFKLYVAYFYCTYVATQGFIYMRIILQVTSYFAQYFPVTFSAVQPYVSLHMI